MRKLCVICWESQQFQREMKHQVCISYYHLLFPLSLSSSTPFFSAKHYLQLCHYQMNWNDQGGWTETEENKCQNWSAVNHKGLTILHHTIRNSAKPKKSNACHCCDDFLWCLWLETVHPANVVGGKKWKGIQCLGMEDEWEAKWTWVDGRDGQKVVREAKP
jgi:hypothetical protein